MRELVIKKILDENGKIINRNSFTGNSKATTSRSGGADCDILVFTLFMKHQKRTFSDFLKVLQKILWIYNILYKIYKVIAQYNKIKAKLSDTQRKKLKLVTLKVKKTKNFCKVFKNHLSIDVRAWKIIMSKIIQSGGFSAIHLSTNYFYHLIQQQQNQQQM